MDTPILQLQMKFQNASSSHSNTLFVSINLTAIVIQMN